MLTQDIKEILLASQPFKYLSPLELDTLLSYCTITSFFTGETVFKQGQKSDGMCVIIHGKAVVTVKILGEEVLNLATLEQGSFIGEMSLMEIGPATATVFASNEVKCLFIPTAYFDMLSLSYPEIKYKITKAITEEICNRIHSVNEKIMSTISGSDISKNSIFKNIIKSFSLPLPTTLEAAHVNIDNLYNSDAFKNFTPEEFAQVLEYATLIKTPENCTLIKQDTLTSPCYIIVRGAVQLSITENNKVAKLAVIGPSTLFSSISFIDHKPSTISYMTCERANLLKISEANLEKIKEINIQLWQKLFNGMCKSIASIEKSANKLRIRLNSELYNQ